MKFLASDLTVREQSWRRGRSLYECWVRLGRRWRRTCWGLARMFSNRVSSASSASCDAVGSVSWYRLSRTVRRTCASIRPLSDEVAKPHKAGEAYEELGEHHRLVNRLQRITVHSVTAHDMQSSRSITTVEIIRPTHYDARSLWMSSFIIGLCAVFLTHCLWNDLEGRSRLLATAWMIIQHATCAVTCVCGYNVVR